VRVASFLLTAGLAAVVGCSSGDKDASPETRSTAETRAAPTPPPATTSDESGGGFFEELSALVGADEVSRCIDDVVDHARPTSGGRTVAAVARDVERLRRLRLEKLPKPRYLTGRALTRRVEGLLEEYPDAEAEADGRALAALGALPRGADLKALLGRALAGQVAGFYDPRTGELVVDSGEDPALGGLDRVILAHELEHALADQAFGLPDAVRAEEPAEGSEDAAVAATALVEGDATLLMQAYAVDNLSFVDAIRSIAPLLASERELAALPYYIREGLVFSYEEGLRFVCELYERGGWRAVDRAYRMLPSSTAEILFPDRYGRGERPIDPPDPPHPGGAWRRIDRQALGAADLLLLFEAPGDDKGRGLDDARRRVESWAGGELHTWARGNRTAVALGLVDRQAEGSLCGSMKAWRAAGRVNGIVRCAGRHVRVGVADDARTAARLVSLQRVRRLR
jgi:hypothetical protein